MKFGINQLPKVLVASIFALHLNTYSQDELLQLIELTNNKPVEGISKNILIEINNYIKSCVNFINYEIKGETKKYFQKFRNNSCFSYEKKIKTYLNSIRL